MWYPCNCSNCDQNQIFNIYPTNKSQWSRKGNMSPSIFHMYNDTERKEDFAHQNNKKNVLRKSATISVISTCQDQMAVIAPTDRKVSSKLASDSGVEEYSPENDSIGDGKELKTDFLENWIETTESSDGMRKNSVVLRKNKYSDTLLKTDGTLPPVIRRRNQNRRKQLAASLIDSNPTPNSAWEKQPPTIPQKGRSQSVSDDHWNQMLAVHGAQPSQGYPVNAACSEVGGASMAHRGFKTMGGNTRPVGRGMVSSASVCDLNSMAQQQQQQQNQHEHHAHGYPGMHSANSFQQLSLLGYDPNMMWMRPSACPICQPAHMYPHSIGPVGMKRTTSNLSMNLSSVGSDMTGYPWAGNPHVHHHMPVGYPGYYPAPCHQQMMPPGYGHGSSMSIPDSMRSYNRIHSSPAPSVRSTSHRSHKSSKSRSFSAADGGRRSRNHSHKRSEESDVSGSSSISDDDNVLIAVSKSSKPWQCDHCTFINPGHVQACGMCSKIPGHRDGRGSRRGVDRKKIERRRERKTGSADNAQDLSDYDNHKREIRRETRLKSIGSVKSSLKSKTKSHKRDSSPRSCSASGSDGDEAGHLDKQLRDLKLTSRSHVEDSEKLSVTSRTKDTDRERGSLKKEGKRGYRKRV